MSECAEELLTEDELQFILLTRQLTITYGRIVADGALRRADLHEGVEKIHQLQAMVMAQAAARAYPDIFRLLGADHPGWEPS